MLNQVRHLDTMELAEADDMEEELSVVNRESKATNSQTLTFFIVRSRVKVSTNENDPDRSVQRRRNGDSHYDYGLGTEGAA